nr:unnamed protein product [Digitaria exilis]
MDASPPRCGRLPVTPPLEQPAASFLLTPLARGRGVPVPLPAGRACAHREQRGRVAQRRPPWPPDFVWLRPSPVAQGGHRPGGAAVTDDGRGADGAGHGTRSVQRRSGHEPTKKQRGKQAKRTARASRQRLTRGPSVADPGTALSRRLGPVAFTPGPRGPRDPAVAPRGRRPGSNSKRRWRPVGRWLLAAARESEWAHVVACTAAGADTTVSRSRGSLDGSSRLRCAVQVGCPAKGCAACQSMASAFGERLSWRPPPAGAANSANRHDTISPQHKSIIRHGRQELRFRKMQ